MVLVVLLQHLTSHLLLEDACLRVRLLTPCCPLHTHSSEGRGGLKHKCHMIYCHYKNKWCTVIPWPLLLNLSTTVNLCSILGHFLKRILVTLFLSSSSCDFYISTKIIFIVATKNYSGGDMVSLKFTSIQRLQLSLGFNTLFSTVYIGSYPIS